MQFLETSISAHWSILELAKKKKSPLFLSGVWNLTSLILWVKEKKKKKPVFCQRSCFWHLVAYSLLWQLNCYGAVQPRVMVEGSIPGHGGRIMVGAKCKEHTCRELCMHVKEVLITKMNPKPSTIASLIAPALLWNVKPNESTSHLILLPTKQLET